MEKKKHLRNIYYTISDVVNYRISENSNCDCPSVIDIEILISAEEMANQLAILPPNIFHMLFLLAE